MVTVKLTACHVQITFTTKLITIKSLVEYINITVNSFSHHNSIISHNVIEVIIILLDLKTNASHKSILLIYPRTPDTGSMRLLTI